MTRRDLAVLVLASACSHTPGTLRFRNEAPHWAVDDRSEIAEPKAAGVWNRVWFYDHDVTRPVDYALSVPTRHIAENVNSLGEVPDSSWFTNRIGVREVTVAEMRRGPNTSDGPTPPLVVTKAQPDGGGFFVEDASGAKWVVKLDLPGRPELGSTADVIAQRLLWAVGYNVPEDSVVEITRDQLVLADDATVELDGRKRPLTDVDIQSVLDTSAVEGGRYRVLASKFLAGKPKGPYAIEGRRRDDPNDRVPHEHRRDLRGQYVFFGWLSHTDLHAGNRLDMWIETSPGRGHLVHNLIDFDRSLGALAVIDGGDWDTYRHRLDYGYLFASVFTLGLWKRPWEGVPKPARRGVGRFDSEHFTPDGYHPRDYFTPFLHKDDLDCFWAAKILLRIRNEHIRAAVDAARLSDRHSADYLVRVLVERRDAIGRHWFRRVNPLDGFRVSPRTEELCATDLLVHHHFDDGRNTRYSARAFDGAGQRLAWRRTATTTTDGTFCVDALPQGSPRDGYLIVSLATTRGDKRQSPVFVHLAREPETGTLRVIGLDRRL